MKTLHLALAVFTVLEVVNAQNIRVTVNEGILVGKTVRFSEDTFINKTRDVDLFLGVPFAEPPERFAPPLPKASWTGERNATEFSAACVQDPYEDLYAVTSEDCLYLNIYAPSQRQPGTPVMVWIHGGGFSAGTAMTYDYSGIPLVTVGDVIIVTINYRLNIFAQFSTEDDVAPGNYGMLDQVAGLEWIYNNIEAFDGNKDDITIFGESAGSASVSFHLLSKLSRGFFNKAILQSGSAFKGNTFKHDPERERRLSRELGVAFGCDTSTSEVLVACLKLQEADELRTKANELYNLDGGYPVTLDGTFLADTPTNLYEIGDFARVPLLAGFNKDEGTFVPFLFLQEYVGSPTPPVVNRTTFDSFLNYFKSFGFTDDILGDSINQEYIDWTIADDPDADYFLSLVDLGTDIDFAAPTDYVIREHANAGGGGVVYKYFMTHEPTKSIFQVGDVYPSTPWLGAGHSEDLTFVFGMPFIDELYNIKAHNMTAEENALSVKFMEFWTNFAKSGDPSRPSEDVPRGDGEDFWPLYTIPELSHKELSLELGVGRAARARGCRFWNHYMPTLISFTSNIDQEEKEWRESYDDWKDDMMEWQRAFEDYKDGTTCN
ncbi:LOW QUALITY PROTEIN: cocaine esterase-like [Diadema antillarum]|uniref:LOW QUALITY PROTEIN: cocaine esterase-like n=1 Tax=Diadema antillarum TaxID=105358 RepID=UPI003A8887C3